MVNKISEIDKNKVLQLHKNLGINMTSKGIKNIENLVTDDYTLTHITGYKQPKEQWYSQMLDEQMKYYSVELIDYLILIESNNLYLLTKNIVDARIYGSRNKWKLALKHKVVKINNKWKIQSSIATTY